MNWPPNVVPAVMVGLSGLVPYGFVAVGLPSTVGSTISAFGPADNSSPASMIPPGIPTSSSAARTVSLGSANGGSSGKIRPKSAGLAGAPPPPQYPLGDSGEGARAAAGAAAAPATTEPAASPAPAAPTPFKNSRRDGRLRLLMTTPPSILTHSAAWKLLGLRATRIYGSFERVDQLEPAVE